MQRTSSLGSVKDTFFINQWRKLQSFSFREKVLVAIFLFVGVSSFLYWGGALYRYFTVEIPRQGGTYIEGIVGNPLYINPILAKANGPDYDISRLVYSGLFKYTPEGSLQEDIAQDYTISEDGKEYIVHIKQGIFWHDGEGMDAEDVVFTLNRIQELAFKSPLREAWLNVEVKQGEDPYTLLFSLEDPRADFLELLTVGILPKHLWENVGAENFALNRLNLEPIGTGPYRFDRSQKDANGKVLIYELLSFEEYYNQRPYIDSIVFKFYPDREALLMAYKNKEVRGMGGIDISVWEELGEYQEHLDLHSMRIPHYYVAYFNPNKSESLGYEEVRDAIALATDRESLVEQVFQNRASIVRGPFLPNMIDGGGDSRSKEERIEEANRLLEDDGWVRGEDGIREKDGVRLEFDFSTADWPEFTRSADILRDQWSKIGVRANVKVVSVYDLWNNSIKPREYDALLFAHTTTLIPDVYPYWNSSKTKDPGLNLAMYKGDTIDELTQKLRVTRNEEERREISNALVRVLEEENPALYLLSPEYLYPVHKEVQGMKVQEVSEDADRFFDIGNWYIKTKRAWNKEE